MSSIESTMHELDKDLGKIVDEQLRPFTSVAKAHASNLKLQHAQTSVLDLDDLEKKFADEIQALKKTKKTILERKEKLDAILVIVERRVNALRAATASLQQSD